MPTIRSYEAPNLGLSPTETGVQAAAQAGNRIGRFYSQVAAGAQEVGNELARGVGSAIKDAGDVVVKYAEHREISQGAAAYAKLNDGLTQKWNETAKNADPNDPTVAEKFRQQTLEPALEEYRQSFLTEGGRRFAESRIDSMRNHMFEKTAADMTTLAANAVSVNIRQTGNSLSNTAITDPSAVPHLLDSADSLVGDMVNSAPNLKGAMAAKARTELTQKIKEDIVKAGAIGAIQKAANPEAEAEKWGAKYPDFINGAELKMLSANARQQIRARRTDEAYSEHLQEKAATRASDARETQYLQKLYSDDPKEQGQVSTKAIVNDPTLTRTAKERMINVVNRELKPETDAKTSARTSARLMGRLADPNTDPDEIMKAAYEARAKDPGTPDSLTKADFADIQKQIIDRKTPQGQALAQDRDEFFKRYAATIDPSMGDVQSVQFGHHTALGLTKMYEAQKAARRAEAEAKAKGQDPHSIYDPSSSNFFGKPANLMRFTASLQDAAAYQASLGKGAATPPPDGNLTGPGKTITGVTTTPAPIKPPEAGAVMDGYRFKGGNPAKPESWEKVQ